MRHTLITMALSGVAWAALAQPVPAFDPTSFASLPPPAAPAKSLGLKASVGMEAFDRRREVPGAASLAWRSVLDFRREWQLNDRTRLTLSNRLEWLQDSNGRSTLRNALREGFASARIGDALFVDVGRINLRSGVGLGFNPTDWLREGASLPQTTQNPASQRENRLGTVMVKLQMIEAWGAAQLALIPHLAHRRDEASPYGLNFGHTNEDAALHVRLAPKLNEQVSLDALAYARQGRHPQWGVNTTAVLDDTVIAHLEWATGRRHGLSGPLEQGSTHRHHRLATGLSWTAPNGAVLAIERQLSTDALNRSDWDAWRLNADGGVARRLGALRAERAGMQEPLVRDAWFMRASLNGWLKDPAIDVSAFLRYSDHDRSRLWQIDGAWHATPQVSAYATVGGFAGQGRSEFGANPLRHFAALRIEVAY